MQINNKKNTCYKSILKIFEWLFGRGYFSASYNLLGHFVKKTIILLDFKDASPDVPQTHPTKADFESRRRTVFFFAYRDASS